MNLTASLKKLCGPAYFYLVVSVLVMILVIVQNTMAGAPGQLCIGAFSCGIPSLVLVGLGHLLYIVFWTIILDALCKYGLKKLSWLLVLLPFILAAIAFGLAVMKDI